MFNYNESLIDYQRYSIKKYYFKELIEKVFNCNDLCELHKKDIASFKKQEVVTVEEDNNTVLHKIFYKKINDGWSEFIELYIKLISEVIKPNFFNDEPVVYQKFPTFRIQLPNNLSVGEWHKDEDYNHPPFEINFKVPLTEAKETSAMWIEQEPGNKNYMPLNMTPGDIVSFNGNKCIHGNKINKTGKTRVDFDFRIILLSKYDADFSKSSVSAGKKFTIGEYYEKIE